MLALFSALCVLSLEPRTCLLATRTHYLRKVTHRRPHKIASSRAPVGAKKMKITISEVLLMLTLG